MRGSVRYAHADEARRPNEGRTMRTANITADQVTEYETHKFSTFASDIDLRPGHWPERLHTTLGNGQNLLRVRKKVDAEGDLQYVVYQQSLGCIELRIYND